MSIGAAIQEKIVKEIVNIRNLYYDYYD